MVSYFNLSFNCHETTSRKWQITLAQASLRLRVISNRQVMTSEKLGITNYRLQITYYRLPITEY